MQHTKFDSHASNYRAAHEMWLTCSTQSLTHVSHVSFDSVTRQKFRTHVCLVHASINLDMSCTVLNNYSGYNTLMQPLICY